MRANFWWEFVGSSPELGSSESKSAGSVGMDFWCSSFAFWLVELGRVEFIVREKTGERLDF